MCEAGVCSPVLTHALPCSALTVRSDMHRMLRMKHSCMKASICSCSLMPGHSCERKAENLPWHACLLQLDSDLKSRRVTGGLRGVAPLDGRRDGRGDEDHLVLLEQAGAGKGAGVSDCVLRICSCRGFVWREQKSRA